MGGYTENVDWVHSSAMDLFFWNAYYNSSVCKSATKKERAQNMFNLLCALHVRVPYMFDELGFRVSLAASPGKFSTYPNDYESEIHDMRPIIERTISQNLGLWP